MIEMGRIVCFLMLAAEVLSCRAWGAEAKRPITASDCVAVRDLLHSEEVSVSAIKISPDGRSAAYPVRSPDLGANENRVEIYVKSLNAQALSVNKPVIVGDISSMRWTPDGRHLSLLVSNNGLKELEDRCLRNGCAHRSSSEHTCPPGDSKRVPNSV
jgi:hypothetical protein